MLAKEVVDLLKGEIQQAKAKGLTLVSLESLEHVSDTLEEQCQATKEGVPRSEEQMEYLKAQITDQLNDNQREFESSLEMLRSTIAISHIALKSSILINGGAAVAMLAFMGGAWSRLPSQSAKAAIALALSMFVYAVLVAGVSTGCAYIAQAGLGGEWGKHSEKIGEIFRWITIILFFGSMALFYLGSRSAAGGFSLV